MPDEPQDTQAQRRPGGAPRDEGSATAAQDAATGTAGPRGGPSHGSGTTPEPAEPMTNEPVAVAQDEPGVGLSPPDETIDGNRGM